jgi:SAM-dependent methyltransferase
MHFDRVVFFGRSGAEGLEMFGLDPSSCTGLRVLDCPGGPGSLAALLRQAGAEVTAVDPRYAAPAAELERLARADLAVTMTTLRANPQLALSFDLDAYEARKREALAAFLDDLRRHPHSYVAAALPDLPFPSARFDLVLCGHLLFSYAPLGDGGLMRRGGLDLAWHRRALAELLRVSAREVRLYPAHTLQGEARRHPYAEILLAQLPEPWHGGFVPSRYDQGHPGRTEGLRLLRR